MLGHAGVCAAVFLGGHTPAFSLRDVFDQWVIFRLYLIDYYILGF